MSVDLEAHPPAGVPVKAFLVWVPGATHLSASVFRGLMDALAAEGYASVAVRLQKSRCALPTHYIREVMRVCASLPRQPIVVGHSFAAD
jgi:hypothetical protein